MNFSLSKIICLTVTALSASCVMAQATFQKVLGETDFYNRGNSVKQCADGGYILAGRTVNFKEGGIQANIVRTDPLGNMLWSKMFGGRGAEEAMEVQITNDHGFVFSGYTNSFGKGSKDFYMVRINAKGDTLWTSTYGGERIDGANSVKQTKDGGFVITGETYSFGVGSVNTYVIRADKNGKELWGEVYGGNGIEEGKCVVETSDNGFIITGKTNSFGAGDYDIYLISTTANGKERWMNTFGGSGTEEGNYIEETKEGGFIITGYTKSFGAGGMDVYVVRTDAKGKEIWSMTFGGKNDDVGMCIKQTKDGGFIVAGSTNSYGGGSEIYLMKLDGDGHILWSKSYGAESDDYGNSVDITLDSGFVIGGYTIDPGETEGKTEKKKSLYLIKTDASGNISQSSGNVRDLK